jgi:hypothetical protein
MWDQLNPLQPATVKEIQTVLFLCKLLRYIRDLINPCEFQDPETITQWCNEIWEDRSHEELGRRRRRFEAHSPLQDTFLSI